MMRRISLLIATVSLVALVGCQGRAQNSAPTSGKKTFKIALALDVGGVSDQSFNQSAWEGAQKAEKTLGIKAIYKESRSASEYAQTIGLLSDMKANLVIANGEAMAHDVLLAAKKYPHQQYAIIDYVFPKGQRPPNVISTRFAVAQAAYLAGYAAAETSKTGQVAFIGGKELAVTDALMKGFINGAKAQNPEIKVKTIWLHSFTDAAKGRVSAQNLYRSGVDVIFHAAGPAGDGVIEAAKTMNKWVIGVDRDQSNLAPKNVLTSVLTNTGNAVIDLAKVRMQSSTLSSAVREYTLKNGGVGIVFSPNLTPELTRQLKSEIQKINAGKVHYWGDHFLA